MHLLARADFSNRKQIVHEILHPEDRHAPQKRIYGINYSALEAAVRRIQQDVDFLMKYLPKVPDDAYVKVETTLTVDFSPQFRYAVLALSVSFLHC